MAKERVEVSLQITRLLTLGSEKHDYHKGHFTKKTVLVKTPLTVGSQGSPNRTLGPLSSRTHVVRPQKQPHQCNNEHLCDLGET